MLQFLSKPAGKIMAYFFANPQNEPHLRELAGILSMDPGNLSKQMQRLVETGFLRVRERGRLKLYTLNSGHPLYREIRGIVQKTEGVEIAVSQALKGLKGIEEAFVYGSFAAGTADAGSDLDVMIIGNIGSVEVSSVLRPLEKRIGREIHYRILSRKELEKRLKKKDAFVSSVMKGKKIPLVAPHGKERSAL